MPDHDPFFDDGAANVVCGRHEPRRIRICLEACLSSLLIGTAGLISLCLFLSLLWFIVFHN